MSKKCLKRPKKEVCWKRGLPSWKGGASVEALAALAAAAVTVQLSS